MAVLMKTYCAFGLPRCTKGTQSANWQASCGVASAVLEIRGREATDLKYIPVSALRAPCTPTARYGFLGHLEH